MYYQSFNIQTHACHYSIAVYKCKAPVGTPVQATPDNQSAPVEPGTHPLLTNIGTEHIAQDPIEPYII